MRRTADDIPAPRETTDLVTLPALAAELGVPSFLVRDMLTQQGIEPAMRLNQTAYFDARSIKAIQANLRLLSPAPK